MHSNSELQTILIVTGSPVYSLGMESYINNQLKPGMLAQAIGVDEVRAQLGKAEAVVLDEELVVPLKSRGIRAADLPRTILLSARDHSGSDFAQLKINLCAYFGARWTMQALEKQIVTIRHCSQPRKSDSLVCRACCLRRSWDAQKLPISSREMQVFEMIAKGMRPASISRELGIGVKTIESHQSSIMRKLAIESTAELRVAALRWRRGETIRHP